jgi:hypothetical protein
MGASLSTARWLPPSICFVYAGQGYRVVQDSYGVPQREPLFWAHVSTPEDSEPIPEASNTVDAWDAQQADTTSLDGEMDGRWLLTPGVAGKRIDVVIRDLASFPRTNSMNVSPTMLRDDDKCVILLCASRLFPADLKKTITLYNIRSSCGRRGPILPLCIRPRRTLDDGKSIREVVTRVVVLGPDVNQTLISYRITHANTTGRDTHIWGPGCCCQVRRLR